ncbi:MAG: DUF445 family protein [Synechococcales bacterium]|nr:DUF445 family protein [Synechococcales bacterium]
MNFSTVWLFIAPSIVGGIIGYFTNDIAIRMLFRPYRPWYIRNVRVPFTPGVIPRNQARLAQRVSDTIMSSLLTPDEIQGIARRLLQVERIQAALLWILRLALEQLQTGREENTTRVLANILHDLFGESLPRLLQGLSKRDDFLKAQLNQIFDSVILEFQLTELQAQRLAEWLLTDVLSPDVLRQLTVDFLTDRNIQVIDDRFREKTSGTYWVVANLFGLRNALVRMRNFCLDEREATNAIIVDLVTSLNIQARLQEYLQDLSLQSLPISTVRQLRRTMRDSVRSYLQASGSSLLQELSGSVNWQNVASVILTRLRNSAVMNESLDIMSHELAKILERYLERDLEPIVMQAIPILQIDQVIIDRVKATAPEEMEAGINDLVQTELQAIVNLGGVLGVAIGLVQSVTLLWQR